MEEIKFMDHQLLGNEKAAQFPGFGYFMEMGTGKTATTILRLRTLMNERRKVLRILIFTPPLVVPQWKDEWVKFSKLDPKFIHLLQGPGKRRVRDFLAHAFDKENNRQPGIFVTNYESLALEGHRDKKSKQYVPGPLLRAFQLWEPEAIVYDESHDVKSWETERSKLAYELANPWDMRAKRFGDKPKTYLLTGTPVLNSQLDVFQQVKVMLGGWPLEEWFMSDMRPGSRLLIDNPFHFRNKYFRDRNAGMPKDRYFPKWEPATLAKDGFDAEGEINRTLSRISLRVMKDECLDLPEEVSVPMRIGMTKDQAKAYTDMKRDLITYVGDKACVATMALTKALRLMQIASGFISLAGAGDELDRADHRFENAPKDAILRELLQRLVVEAKEKVIIWAVWKENYAAIRNILEEFGIKYVEIHGDVGDRQKLENVQTFTNDPTTMVCVGHPGSGGVGLNMTVAAFDIYYSRTFSLKQYLQSRSRTHRGGQSRKVTHYDLICQNTIEELALARLAQKIEIGEKLLGDLTKELAMQPAEY